MNLLAVLSVDQTKTLGEMEWYGTVVPLISLQLNVPLTPTTTCGDLLVLILELPGDVRLKVLAVTVPDTALNEEAMQEVKQESHRSMLLGLSAALLVSGVCILFWFVISTKVEGGTVDKELMGALWEIVKEAASLIKGS